MAFASFSRSSARRAAFGILAPPAFGGDSAAAPSRGAPQEVQNRSSAPSGARHLLQSVTFIQKEPKNRRERHRLGRRPQGTPSMQRRTSERQDRRRTDFVPERESVSGS